MRTLQPVIAPYASTIKTLLDEGVATVYLMHGESIQAFDRESGNYPTWGDIDAPCQVIAKADDQSSACVVPKIIFSPPKDEAE